MIEKIFAIAKYTVKESIRSKVFYALILFGIIMFSAVLFLSYLGQEQEKRLLLDLGYILIELIVLLTILYTSTTFLLEEIKNRTIYYIFVRKIPRGYYVLGRYVGIISIAAISIIFMSILHLLLLISKGWTFDISFIYVNISLFLKVVIISSIGLFFAMFSSSVQVAFLFTFFFWLLGHFCQEIKFITDKISNPVSKMFLKTILYILPNFQYFNFRDIIGTGVYNQIDLPNFVIISILYCVVYSFICLFLTSLMLSKKEV